MLKAVAKTADEVLEKYAEAETINPAWERVTIFSWSDMVILRDEILRLRGNKT